MQSVLQYIHTKKISAYLYYIGTDGFMCQNQNIPYRVRWHYGTMSFNPEKMFRNYMFCMRWQIQSAFHENSTLPLGLARNGCIKPLCSFGTFKTGLKHQRLRTAFSWKHIWNLPASLHFGNL